MLPPSFTVQHGFFSREMERKALAADAYSNSRDRMVHKHRARLRIRFSVFILLLLGFFPLDATSGSTVGRFASKYSIFWCKRPFFALNGRFYDLKCSKDGFSAQARYVKIKLNYSNLW